MTFISSRVVVYLIMSHAIPDLYLFVGETHVHHLNYGIFLLSGVGAYLLFHRPMGRARFWATVIYGIGLALTFDEFGMWLHLDDDYWQRASYDAVVVIIAILGAIAAAPSLRNFSSRDWVTASVLLVLLAVFAFLVAHAVTHAKHRAHPQMQQTQRSGK